MNKLKQLSLLLLFLCSALTTYTQISGNQIYGNNNSHHANLKNSVAQKRTVYSTDSTLVINARILMNKRADNYLVSLGLNQEEKTVKECNTKINQRINRLKNNLKKLGIEKEDVYSDFVSQTKVYDYNTSDKRAQQFHSGFEIKKNLILRLKDIENFDQLIEYCAAEEIYDIIKVEYLDNEIDETYLKMYEEAVSFIAARKKLYLKINNQKLSGNTRIAFDNFYSIAPKMQYKKYQAYESSELKVQTKDYKSHFIRKEARKNKTFYYDALNVSGFDKVINNTMPDVALQYVLELTIVYDLVE